MSHGKDVSRGTWDIEAYEKRAADRVRAEREAEMEKQRARKASVPQGGQSGEAFGPTRAWLQKRDHSIDFESKVGSSELVNGIEGGGFHCKVCRVTMKDSNRYLNHVNSRTHQKALGMSMRVRRSTPEEVRAAFEVEVRRLKARKKAEREKAEK